MSKEVQFDNIPGKLVVFCRYRVIRTADSFSKAKLFRKSREDGHWTYRREDLNTFCIGRANLTLPTCRPKLHQAFPHSDAKPLVDLLMQYYCPPPSMREEKTSQRTEWRLLMPEVGCCRTRRLGALPHCGRARGGSTMQSNLVVGKGEVGFGGIRSVEANEVGGPILSRPR